ncbi:hypothetical protein [Hazenella coriacea]|uniref:YfzA-like protein n=1 Tax=Hazenella coriacea TaxID=1179467 RepID=A0A4R3L5R4_9BACL|nr:hypothetical protein [Hazenella coriacea]TCS94150.1 hypothetical protein EDD58_10416 [Hazenella coriacea]
MRDSHEEKCFGAEYAKLERKYFYGHFLIFVIAHIVFIFIFGLIPSSELPSGSYGSHLKEWILSKENEFYIDETGNSISSVWTTVIIIHAIWPFSYIFFPKKSPNNKDQNVKTSPKDSD